MQGEEDHLPGTYRVPVPRAVWGRRTALHWQGPQAAGII